MQENFKCVVCCEDTKNKDIHPISGLTEIICENCVEQLLDQVQEIPIES